MTTCGTAPDACHLAPTCAGGTCGAAANAADGAKCGDPPDACHDAPKCASGACAAPVEFAEGAVPTGGDANARCCGGVAVETTTDKNCGVCGWACGSGQTCTSIYSEYLCTGCTTDGDCASGCCSTDPGPNHCSPSNCDGVCQSPTTCTGGSHCVEGSEVDYCTY
jgi:hypothetical protein